VPQVSAGMPQPPGLEAEITRTNFNFPTIETTRAQMFERRVVTRKIVTVHERADSSSRSLASLPKGKAVDALDMNKGWFKIKLAGGRVGYLDNSTVDVPPSAVEATHVRTKLQTALGGTATRSVTLDGTYRVLDMRYVPGKGLWYQLAVDNAPGWVSASVVRARFSLPIVHFVAGLYRYHLKRYDDAQREFAQYLSAPDSTADNPSLASAYQLLGASMLLSTDGVFRAGPSALENFTKAVDATPYDPSAYSMRALSTIAVRRQVGKALEDLQHALSLDPTDLAATRIIDTVRNEVELPQSPSLMHLLEDGREPGVKRLLRDLATRYPVKVAASDE
jgi:tetratricopeptide (TPR) repeat protein